MNRLSPIPPYIPASTSARSGSSHRPAIALLGLGAFLASQCVLPLADASAQVNRMNEALKAPAVPPPAWWDGAADKGPGKFKPSARVLGVKDDEVSLKKLDLNRAPSEKELRMAGQFGGALSPMSSADAGEWERKGASAKQLLRLQNMNWSFGRAIQDWNGHKYAKAAKMFKQHVEDYPDSPWAGEALLHLGCDAKYGGRFAEAQATFENLIANTSSKANDPSWEIHQKAKLRWADLDMALGRYAEAESKLADIIKTDTDWRRKTWARHWLMRAGRAAKNKRVAAACGNRALAWALEQGGNKAAAKRVAALIPPREAGFSLEELQRIAAREGLRTRGFKAPVASLAQLPTPFLVHLEYGRKRPTKFDMPSWKNPKRAYTTDSTRSVFTRPNQLGHYLVVSKVDTRSHRVKLWDPQEKRPYTMTYGQLQQEWTGRGLALLPKSKAVKVADISSAQLEIPSQKSVLWLSKSEMTLVRGGCCGIQSAEDTGCSTDNQGVNGNCGAPPKSQAKSQDTTGPILKSSKGSPVITINRASTNLFLKDTPIWYTPPVGPPVEITMSYNSQDATNQNSVFGNKWTFNYGSYLVMDTGGEVTVFNSDGSKDVYSPNGTGGFISPAGKSDSLIHINNDRYEIRYKDGDKAIYDIPSGTSIQQSMVIELSNRWGYSLSFDYNSAGQMTAIIDAQGKETTLEYNAAGKIWRVTDPFGRRASFLYDSNGNMVEATDVEGNSFQYVYDAEVNVIELGTAQGPWKFNHEPADGIFNNFDMYPPPGGNMWENSRLTVTDPLNQKEEFHYDAYHGASWYVDKNHYRPWAVSPNNSSGLVPKEYWKWTELIPMQVNSQIDFTQTIYSDGANVYTSPAVSYQYGSSSNPKSPTEVTNSSTGNRIAMSYNFFGQPTSVTDYKNNVTSFSYYSNGSDVHTITNAENNVIATYEYDLKHQPTKVTDAFGKQTDITYTPWGAVSTVTDADNHVTTYHYNSSGQLQYVDTDNLTLGSFTYDPVGRIHTRTGLDGVTLTYEYTALDQVKKVTYPDGTYEETQYVCCGLPGMVRDRAGRTTYYDYDPLKRLIRIQDPAGRTIDIHYDKNGNRTKIIDANGNETKWDYDSRNLVTKKIFADGATNKFEYNSLNLLASSTDAQNRTTTYSYDANNNLTGINYTNDADVSIAYTALDKPEIITDGLGTTTVNYDDMGRVATVDGPWNNDTVSYSYNALGHYSNLSVQRNNISSDNTAYNYDVLGRLDTLTATFGSVDIGTFDYNYDSQTKRLNQLLLPNGTKTNYNYNSLGQLSGIENLTSVNALISRYTYGYDSGHKGLRVSQTKEVGQGPAQTINYGYDTANQLTSEVSAEATPLTNTTYSYDFMGNRREVVNKSNNAYNTSTYGVNNLNQITNSVTSDQTQVLGQSSYDYDADGNLTNRASGQGGSSYEYDQNNRLIRVISKNSDTGINLAKTEFSYDSMNRKRVCREYSWDVLNQVWVKNGEKRYIYDGLTVVQERDENNTVTASLVRGVNKGGGIGGLLSRTTYGNANAGTHFYHYDGGGNVCQLTSSAEDTEATYTYNAFGVAHSAGTGVATENPYRYSTKEYHAQAGIYDYGYRFLSPSLGCWLNRDPIGERGGLNLYGYVYNNPINLFDPDGQAVPIWVTTAAIGGAWGAIGNITAQIATNLLFGREWYCINWFDVGAAIITGMIQALAFAAIPNFLLKMLAGAAINAVQYLATTVAKGEVPNDVGMIANIIGGAAGGAAAGVGGAFVRADGTIRFGQIGLEGIATFDGLSTAYSSLTPSLLSAPFDADCEFTKIKYW